MKRLQHQEYRINYLNPINYLWLIITPFIGLLLAPFVESTWQDLMYETFKVWKGKKFTYPKSIYKKLYMVTKLTAK